MTPRVRRSYIANAESLSGAPYEQKTVPTPAEFPTNLCRLRSVTHREDDPRPTSRPRVAV